MGVKSGAKPRPEVLASDLDDAVFAADFGNVIDGTGSRVYADARTFFDNTHPARDLQLIASAVFDRLAGNDSGGVLRLSTGFGGGKTHTLIALYHLAQHVADPAIGTDILPAAGRPDRVTVVGIDGGKAGNPQFAAHPDAVVTHSLWGELFYRLGGRDAYAALGAVDDTQKSPTARQIADAIPAGPVLILLDEIVIYMARLDDQGRGNLLGFITALAAVVAQRPQTVMVITDPAAQAAYATEAGLLQRATSDATALNDVLGRTVSDFDPVGSETAQVIVRRLFTSVDRTAAQRASAQYLARYRGLIEARTPIPGNVTTADYAKEVVDCYPFHPRLLKTARERLSALPQYNRSRGTLRLFARIIRTVWESQADPELVTAGDIDWASPRILAELLRRLQRDGFTGAVDADVLGHAVELDNRTTGNLAGLPGIHRRVASALLFESLAGEANDGLDDEEATLATFRLDDAGHEAAEALHALASTCWHVYPMPNGRGFQFRIPANIWKQIEERRARISRTDAEAKVRTNAEAYYRGAAFGIAAWPNNPRDVADSARLKLAICDTEDVARRVLDSQDDTPGLQRTREFVNAILAVAPEATRLQEAIEQAQRLLAAHDVRKDFEGGDNQEALSQLKAPITELERRVKLASARAFSRVLVKGEVATDLDEAHTGNDGDILAAHEGSGQLALRKFLGAKGLIYTEKDQLDPDLLLRLLPGATPIVGEEAYTAKAVHERLLGAPEIRLIPNDDFVRRTIRHACLQGRVAVSLRVKNDVAHTAYDKDGRVDGPVGSRRRTIDQLPVAFPLDDTVRITPANSEVAHGWLAVPDPRRTDDGTDDGGSDDDDIGDIKPPPDDDDLLAATLTATRWDDVVRAAGSRPLLRLRLTAYVPARAQAITTALQPLGAEATTVSTQVKGTARSGGSLDLTVQEVKMSAPFNPLTVARTLFADLAHGGTYRASINAIFGETGRFGIDELLADIAVRFQIADVPEDRVDVVATFAPVPPESR